MTRSRHTKALKLEFQDYAYRVSHDLNAPVRAMVGFSKLLTQEYAEKLDEDAKEYLSLIIENGLKMQAMMESLLKYSRLITKENVFVLVDIGRLIKHLQLSMENSINSAGATFVIGELPSVSADIELITLVFNELIDNAIKFQPTGNLPHIIISAEKKKKFWQFAVADNGIGINQQFQEKIFKLFARLHPDNQYSGVGIGLTLAQKAVHLHGGKIWFESTIGSGSTFYFTLPLV